MRINKEKLITLSDYKKHQDSYAGSLWLQMITLILSVSSSFLFGVMFINNYIIKTNFFVAIVILIIEIISILLAKGIDINNEYIFSLEQYGKKYSNVLNYVKTNIFEVFIKPFFTFSIQLVISFYLGWYLVILYRGPSYLLFDIICFAGFLFTSINIVKHLINIVEWIIDII